MKVLQVTAHYHPNVGGVETHLSDLVTALTSRGYDLFVLTYRPLTTPTDWKIFETRNKLKVLRVPYLPGFFYKLVKNPLLEFLYLAPGLFIALPFVILIFNPTVIHAHGLVAGAVSVFWGKLFFKKVILSTHSIYHFPKEGLYRLFVKMMMLLSDGILCLSNQSVREVIELTGNEDKVRRFVYWVDLKRFSRVKQAKKLLGIQDSFVVLFVGRLVNEKGIRELIKASKIWNKNIKLLIAGTGPLENFIRKEKAENTTYIGRVSQQKLPKYYSASEIVIIPSTHEEGFGRVIIEALACGTIVLGSNKGGISEAIDETVGEIIVPEPKAIAKAVNFYYHNLSSLETKKAKTRLLATERYSQRNVEEIIKSYR